MKAFMRIFFAAVLGIAGICSAQGITFGIIADPQYANTATSGTRYYRSSLTKLAQAADTLQAHAVPFAAVLGDFINGYTAADTALALRDLDSVNLRLDRFTGEKYAVIGNHDVASLSKAEFLGRVSTAVRSNCYSFDKGNYHFVVLDGNYRADGVDFNHSNFTWSDAWASPAEIAWLTADLAAAGARDVFVFIHYILDTTVTSGECLKNASELIRIFENAGNVKAVFSGHAHTGGYKDFNGIHYLVMRGMVENALPANRFAEATVTPAGDSLIVRGYFEQPSYRLRLRPTTVSIAEKYAWRPVRRPVLSVARLYPAVFYDPLGRLVRGAGTDLRLCIVKTGGACGQSAAPARVVLVHKR
jgi:3',5'-cyclic AMP phosphodiesterase CpdA